MSSSKRQLPDSGAAKLLERALQCHRQGDLAGAESAYRQVLAGNPKQPDVLHHLGLIAQQTGRGEEALALLQRAARSRSGDATLHNNLGNVLREAGRFDEAVDAYRVAIECKPDYVNAWYNLGAVLRDHLQLPSDAVEAFEAAVRAAPGDPELRVNLGRTLTAAGRAREAEQVLREAVRLAPDYPPVHLYLGVALEAREQRGEALAAYRDALVQDSDYAEAHYRLGMGLAGERDLAGALSSLETAARLAPGHAGTRLSLAEVYQEVGDIAKAEATLRNALEIAPAYAEAHNRLGLVLVERGRMRGAVDAFRDAVRCDPRSVSALCNLGNSLRYQGELTAARKSYEDALRVEPDYAVAYNNLGHLSTDEGDMAAATDYYRRALAIEPNLAEAHLNLARSRRFGEGDEDDVRRMEAALTSDGLSDDDRANLRFALGKVHDDRGTYDAAFEHYRAANALMAEKYRFDATHFEHWLESLVSSFGTELFERTAGYGNPSELPVFIVGMPRSGTTLVEQILASHPQVHGAGELDDVFQLGEGLAQRLGSERPHPENIALLDKATAAAMADEYLQKLHAFGGGALRVTDKMPSNFFQLGLIAVLFPGARIVHCRRDPMDTCLSNYIQLFAHGHNYSYDLTSIAAYYNGYQRVMQHWHEVLPLSVHEVSYEELVADQEAVSRRLVDSCGLAWDDDCLRYYENERSIQTASHWQVRQPVYTHAMQRWKRYEKYLGVLQRAIDY